MRSFGSFLKEGASTTFNAWKERRLGDGPITWQDLKDWALTTWRKPHQHLLDVSNLGAMKWKGDNLARYPEEYKSKYLQYKCEENPGLGMMGAFLASLDETIRRKVWEREKLPETMMELFDVVIRLGDAREVGFQENPLQKPKGFEKNFQTQGGGPKFKNKRRFENKGFGGGNTSNEGSKPKFPNKKSKRVNLQEAQDKNLCFKCGGPGHRASNCPHKAKVSLELAPVLEP